MFCRVLQLLATVLLMPVAACLDGFGLRDEVDGLWISHTGIVLAVGEETTLKAIVLHDDTGLEPVNGAAWLVSDESVVSLGEDGRITALAEGRTAVFVRFNGSVDSATIAVRDRAEEPRQRWRSVSVGAETTCAVDLSGTAWCWGGNYYGTIGNGSRRQWTQTLMPAAVAGGIRFSTINVGLHHACGLTFNGKAYCWGDNVSGAVGSGRRAKPPQLLVPNEVAGEHTFELIATGDNHACGRTSAGEMKCWGSNVSGEIGDGTSGIQEYRSSPVPVRTSNSFRAIALGRNFSCALNELLAAYCWGNNRVGALGIGNGDTGEGLRSVPQPVTGGHQFKDLSSGHDHVCGIVLSGSALCWGWNSEHQLGGTLKDVGWEPTPIQHDPGLTKVEAGASTSCGLTAIGQAYCWGSNYAGLLGVQETEEECGSPIRACSSRPIAIAPDLRFSMLSVGNLAVCGITLSAALYCWGSNEAGQLGHGRIGGASAVPIRVFDPL